jgi:Uma2 family endonuclease
LTGYPLKDDPMTIAATLTDRITQAESDQCVVLREIGWTGYSTLLRVRGERPVPRMVYLDGSLYLLSPSFPHENLKERLGLFVTEIVVGLDIPHIASGSTTFRRRVKRGGVEGDQTYYLANLARIRGKKKINLRTDPPPDLTVEAVATHEADGAVEVYRRLRVPEVWVCDHARLTILVLQANGRYAEADRSEVFPILTAAEIHSVVTRDLYENDTAWIKELRRWVAEVLLPRHRALKAE